MKPTLRFRTNFRRFVGFTAIVKALPEASTYPEPDQQQVALVSGFLLASLFDEPQSVPLRKLSLPTESGHFRNTRLIANIKNAYSDLNLPESRDNLFLCERFLRYLLIHPTCEYRQTGDACLFLSSKNLKHSVWTRKWGFR